MTDEGEASPAGAGLHRTIPALPVRDVRAAVAHYRAHLGFDAVHETDFGTREFDVSDSDGNLLTFFRWL